jgi:hypothetical protein
MVARQNCANVGIPLFPVAAMRLRLFLGTALLPLLGGCAVFSYDQVQLGQEQQAYGRAFPEDKTRRSPAGLCYLETDGFGRTDAAVLLLTADRRVGAKFYVSHIERRFGPQTETSYQLRGEVDPQLTKLNAAGPIDALRAIADELTSVESDTFVREAHAWIAAGLIRLVQHWPHVGDQGPAFTRLTEVLQRIPAGGIARITIDPRGVYLVEYTQSVTQK